MKSLYHINVFFPFICIEYAAYKTVLHSYGLDSNPSSEDDGNSDLELMDVSDSYNDILVLLLLLRQIDSNDVSTNFRTVRHRQIS